MKDMKLREAAQNLLSLMRTQGVNDDDFEAAEFALEEALEETEPATGTEIGDHGDMDSVERAEMQRNIDKFTPPEESELEQLSDPWWTPSDDDEEHDTHSRFEDGRVYDDNGLEVTATQIIRCKVERDNLLKSLQEVMAELTPAQRAYDACQIAEYVLGDIDRHAEGV